MLLCCHHCVLTEWVHGVFIVVALDLRQDFEWVLLDRLIQAFHELLTINTYAEEVKEAANFVLALLDQLLVRFMLLFELFVV